jgi:hypothetical protein
VAPFSKQEPATLDLAFDLLGGLQNVASAGTMQRSNKTDALIFVVETMGSINLDIDVWLKGFSNGQWDVLLIRVRSAPTSSSVRRFSFPRASALSSFRSIESTRAQPKLVYTMGKCARPKIKRPLICSQTTFPVYARLDSLLLRYAGGDSLQTVSIEFNVGSANLSCYSWAGFKDWQHYKRAERCVSVTKSRTL